MDPSLPFSRQIFGPSCGPAALSPWAPHSWRFAEWPVEMTERGKLPLSLILPAPTACPIFSPTDNREEQFACV